MEVENRGYKCGYFWQKWGGFRTLGSGHTVYFANCKNCNLKFCHSDDPQIYRT